MRLYDALCTACDQFAVLHGVCRACGQKYPEPTNPLEPKEDNAPPRDADDTDTELDDRSGDANDDFDIGAGG